MYTAGAFIRLHVYGKTSYRNIWNLLIALAAAALMMLSVPLIDALAVRLDFYSKGINFVAGSVLQILIIHVNKFFAWTVSHILSSNNAHMDRPYLHVLVKTGCIFLGCLLISIVYRLTVRRVAERVIRSWKFPWQGHAGET